MNQADHQASLTGIFPEQVSLPGIKPAALPAMEGYLQPPILVVVEDRHEVSPDQLTFGANQMTLVRAVPMPQQLRLLPDPPVWETPEDPVQPVSRGGRLAKRRTRSRIGPGQGSLF